MGRPATKEELATARADGDKDRGRGGAAGALSTLLAAAAYWTPEEVRVYEEARDTEPTL